MNTGADRTLFFRLYPPPPPLLSPGTRRSLPVRAAYKTNRPDGRCSRVVTEFVCLGTAAEAAKRMCRRARGAAQLPARSGDAAARCAARRRMEQARSADAVALSDLEPAFGIRQSQSVPMIAATGQGGVLIRFRMLATEALASARKRPELGQTGSMPTSDLSFWQ